MDFIKNLSTPAKIGIAVGVGVVGYIAYSLLTEKTASAAETPAPKPALPAGPAYPDFYATSGGKITTLEVQKILNQIIAQTNGTPLKEDGINGPKTTAAVKAFQGNVGIKVDGIVGPITTGKLRDAQAALNARQTLADIYSAFGVDQSTSGQIKAQPRRPAYVKTRFGYRAV